MKKTIYFIILILTTVIILPLLIVKGCSFMVQTPPSDNKALKVKVYIKSEEKIKEMTLEEYVKGVVAAEMPAEFESEALKAQAVAARTYALGRIKRLYTAKDNAHNEADVCTDPAHCQAWISKEAAMKKWGIFNSSKYWNKIDKAVRATQDIVITYNNIIVNPVFHSNSGGRTENAEDVWSGVEVPYLKSVLSNGEEASAEFKTTVEIKTSDFISKMKSEYPKIKINEKDVLKDLKILEHTQGGRVKTLQAGSVSMKGTDFRRIFSLKSADFIIEKGNESTLKITTQGNGHGVGMSQWGANYIAKNGGTYEEILKYYYSGVEVKKTEN